MRIALACSAIGFLTFAGCGTFSDRMCGPYEPPPAKNPVYYRGVRFDLMAAKEGGWKTLLLFDIPFSAIWDTIRVPSLMREQRKANRDSEAQGERPRFDPPPMDRRE